MHTMKSGTVRVLYVSHVHSECFHIRACGYVFTIVVHGLDECVSISWAVCVVGRTVK